MNPHVTVVNRIQSHFSNDDHEYKIPEIQGILVLTYERRPITNAANPSIDHISMAYSKYETILIEIPNNTIPDILDISVIKKNRYLYLSSRVPACSHRSIRSKRTLWTVDRESFIRMAKYPPWHNWEVTSRLNSFLRSDGMDCSCSASRRRRLREVCEAIVMWSDSIRKTAATRNWIIRSSLSIKREQHVWSSEAPAQSFYG